MADLSEILQLLHTGLAEKLLERIQSGEVSASDLNVARQFLKDNGIDSAPKEGSPLENLARTLPFTESEDEQAAQLPN